MVNETVAFHITVRCDATDGIVTPQWAACLEAIAGDYVCGEEFDLDHKVILFNACEHIVIHAEYEACGL